MKKIIFIILTIITSCVLHAQDKQEIILIGEGMPTFSGGDQAMIKFFADSLKYPHPEMCIEGRVITRFLVKKDGTVDSIHVIKGIHPAFDQEAMRVVKVMPKWIPLRNRPIDTWFTLPISFKLKNE